MSVGVSGVRVSVGVSRCASECYCVQVFVSSEWMDVHLYVRTYMCLCASVCASVFDCPSCRHIRNINVHTLVHVDSLHHHCRHWMMRRHP